MSRTWKDRRRNKLPNEMTKALKEEVKKQRRVGRSLRRKLANENFDLSEDEVQLLMDSAQEAMQVIEEVEGTMKL